MIRVLLDTDHMSLHERGHLSLRARLASFLPEEVAVSIVTVEEMLRGRLAILARRSEGEPRVPLINEDRRARAGALEQRGLAARQLAAHVG